MFPFDLHIFSFVFQSMEGLGIMIIEGSHKSLGKGIYISDIQKNSLAFRVNSSLEKLIGLKNNITLSFDEAYDDISYIKSKKLSQLDEFLKSRDHEFLGEQGSRLSGGQRQRIGIARALYRNPEIIIFDEATSSLDVNTENQIIDDVNKLKGDRTIIIVSHKINTLQNCDHIYEIKDKKIIKVK